MAPTPSPVLTIVVTGPFSAGRTTFIETVVEREFTTMAARTTSDDETSVKRSTTVGLDFGVLRLGDPDGDIELRVHGTPGQARFSFMWEVLAEGSDAYVLVVNGEDPGTWMASRAHQSVMERVGIPGVIAVNRGGEQAVAQAATYFADLPVPVLGCCATEIDDVRQTLVAALVAILDRLEPGPRDDKAFAALGGPLSTNDHGGPA